MKKEKKKRLESAGYKVGTAEGFLELSREEVAFIDMKLSLARSLKKRRVAKRLSQEELAEQLGSSQSRVAKMEAADRTVSIDLLMRSLLTMGVSRSQLAKIIAARSRRAA